MIKAGRKKAEIMSNYYLITTAIYRKESGINDE